MHRLASRDPAMTPWASNRSPNRATCCGSSVGADGVEGLVPGRQEFAGRGVEVVAAGLMPDRQVGVVVLDGVGGWPPDLVIGRGEHLAQLGAGQGAAHGDVDVRGQPPLGFDGGEVLDVVAEEAAQVLDEPVEQRREVQRVPRRPLVVVAGRVGRGAVASHAPVAGAGEGDEHRRPERLAVRCFVGLADGPRGDLPAGQVRGVLAAPRRAVTADRAGGQHVAAHPGPGDLLVQVPDRLVVPGGVLAGWRRPGRGRAGRRRAVRSTCAVRRRGRRPGRWARGRGASLPGTAPRAGSWLVRRRRGRPRRGCARRGRARVRCGRCAGRCGVAGPAGRTRRGRDGQLAHDVPGQRHGQPLRSGAWVVSFSLHVVGVGVVRAGVGEVPAGAVAAAGALQDQEPVAGAGVEQRSAAVGAVVGGEPSGDQSATTSRPSAWMSVSVTNAARTRTGSGLVSSRT